MNAEHCDESEKLCDDGKLDILAEERNWRYLLEKIGSLSRQSTLVVDMMYCIYFTYNINDVIILFCLL